VVSDRAVRYIRFHSARRGTISEIEVRVRRAGLFQTTRQSNWPAWKQNPPAWFTQDWIDRIPDVTSPESLAATTALQPTQSTNATSCGHHYWRQHDALRWDALLVPPERLDG
jgi:hypothetical protein